MRDPVHHDDFDMQTIPFRRRASSPPVSECDGIGEFLAELSSRAIPRGDAIAFLQATTPRARIAPAVVKLASSMLIGLVAFAWLRSLGLALMHVIAR